MKFVDLRSDTVTRPTPGMYDWMIHAPVGDDVYGEDPSINALQEETATLFGKEAGLFVPSGVMANQLAIKAWTNEGDEVIVETESHIFQYETAAPSIISRIQLHTIPGQRGVLDPQTILGSIRPGEYYFPKTTLVCIENTHNRAGGAVYPLENISVLRDVLRVRGIALHLDGARIWNASVRTGTAPAEYGAHVDSISVCFSKGLGAPVGSMILGPRDFIERARRYRKILGGGMRQAGVLAAAARYALRHHVADLAKDHERARTFAEAIRDRSAFSIAVEEVETNMALLQFTDARHTAEDALNALRERNVLVGMSGSRTLRAVFHRDVTDDDLQRAVAAVKEACP